MGLKLIFWSSKLCFRTFLSQIAQQRRSVWVFMSWHYSLQSLLPVIIHLEQQCFGTVLLSRADLWWYWSPYNVMGSCQKCKGLLYLQHVFVKLSLDETSISFTEEDKFWVCFHKWVISANCLYSIFQTSSIWSMNFPDIDVLLLLPLTCSIT